MAPFFIVNAPRSGSTLLSVMLNAHPRLAVFIESVWFSYHAIRLRRFASLPPQRRDQAIGHYLRGLDANAPVKQLVKDETALGQAVAGARGDLGKLFGELCAAWAAQRSGPGAVWGEKSGAHALYIAPIRQAFPEAKFIHLVRDPRANIYSLCKRSFITHSDSAYVSAHSWKRYQDGVTGSLAAVADANKLTVYYEDLVADPEEQMKRVCRFLGAEFDPRMLEHHKSETEIPEDFGSEKASEAVSTSFVEEWKQGLTPVQIASIESFAFDLVLRQRYPPVSPPVALPQRWVSLAYLWSVHAVLSWLEAVFARIRGGPFVWSRLGRMVQALWRQKLAPDPAENVSRPECPARN